MQITANKRNRAADLLKGIAVILMIQVHLVELFAMPEIYISWLGKISLFLGGPPAAPIFMAVMGYFFASSKMSFSKSLLRGFKLITLGFLLNIGLNLNLFIKIAKGVIQTSPWPYVFGVDILFLAGLSLIILSLFKHFFKFNFLPYLLLLGLIFIIQLFDFSLINQSYWDYLIAYFIGEGFWWSYFPIIPWLAYPILGYFLFIIFSKFNGIFESGYRYTLLVSGIITFVFIGYGVEVSSNLSDYYHHGIIFFLYACCFLILYTTIVDLLSKIQETKLSRWVEWLGINVTAAYVVQWLIIGNIATEIYKTQPVLQLVLWLIAILFLTSAGVYFWIKIKFWFRRVPQ